MPGRRRTCKPDRPISGFRTLRPRGWDPVGFAVRRHRNAVAGWGAVAVLVGAGFGPLGNGIDTLTEKNATLRNMLNGGSDATNAFVSFVTILIALVCVGFVVSGVGRVGEEEAGGRLEPALAGALSRGRWLAGHGLALAGGAIVVALTGGVGLGVSNAVAVGDATQVARLLGATLAYLPAVLLLLGLSLTLYGLRPAAMWIGWLALVFVAVVAVLGDTLRLADWVKDLSPLTWVDRVPLQAVSTTGLVGAMLGALFLGAAALIAFRVRDVPTR